MKTIYMSCKSIDEINNYRKKYKKVLRREVVNNSYIQEYVITKIITPLTELEVKLCFELEGKEWNTAD